MSVRVRMAPAPSGSLHVGNVRTFLYDWLFARHNNGTLILRIEDTDQERVNDEHIKSVIDELRWLGLDWDEGPDVGGNFGPYRQSERLDTYRDAADRLMEMHVAYKCYCTPEELAERRKQAQAEGRKPGYDGRCYQLTDAEISAREDEGRRWVMRFHVEPEGETSFNDLVTGPVTFENSEVEDFAIFRQSGYPIYNFGAALDDALMEMTHVIRGLDIQSSTPRQILVLKALGYPVPQYAHIPLVNGPNGKKLSKRVGGGAVEWYRENGYLPDALVNSLALLGTGFGDKDIVSREQMIEEFSLEKVNASPASIDPEKMLWTNGEYIRMLPEDELGTLLTPFLAAAGLVADPPTDDEAKLIRAVVPLVQTRIEQLDAAASLVGGIFKKEIEIDQGSFDKVMKQDFVPELLKRAIEGLESIDTWKVENIESALRDAVSSLELKPRIGFVPFYVAISGTAKSAPLFDSMALIGKEASLERLNRAKQLVEG